MPKAGKQIVDPGDGNRYTLIHTLTLRVLIGIGVWIGIMLTALLILVAIELGHNNRQDLKLSDLTHRTAILQHQEVLNSEADCERTNESRLASIEEKRQSIKTLRKSLHLWRAALAAAAPGELEGNPIAPLFASYLSSLEEELRTKQEGIRSTIEAQSKVAIKPGSPIVDCSKALGKNAEG